jgi:heterodisulfide reductase subunit C
MSGTHHAAAARFELASRLRAATGQSAFRCYQCGKCAAGCPLSAHMDVPPNQALRMLQAGGAELERELLGALSIWLCLTCETCGARCPQEVDVPRVMEFLRQESLRRGTVHPQAWDILAFYRAFLDSVRKTGRLFEVGMIAAYKLKTFHLLQDVLVAPKLLKRGKLSPFAHKVAGREAIERIFARCSAAGDGEEHPA